MERERDYHDGDGDQNRPVWQRTGVLLGGIGVVAVAAIGGTAAALNSVSNSIEENIADDTGSCAPEYEGGECVADPTTTESERTTTPSRTTTAAPTTTTETATTSVTETATETVAPTTTTVPQPTAPSPPPAPETTEEQHASGIYPNLQGDGLYACDSYGSVDSGTLQGWEAPYCDGTVLFEVEGDEIVEPICDVYGEGVEGSTRWIIFRKAGSSALAHAPEVLVPAGPLGACPPGTNYTGAQEY